MIRQVLWITLFMLCPLAASSALVGGAGPADPDGMARYVVLVVGSHGTSCTGTAIARNLVLTAAHCVLPGSEYRWVEFDRDHRATLKKLAEVVPHPRFDLHALLSHRATADIAVLKPAEDLSDDIMAVALAPSDRMIGVGDRFTVVGYGVSVRGDGRSGGTIRAAVLTTTGQPGPLQIRLVDPSTADTRAGLGACSGDSGAPVFVSDAGQVGMIGLVSWSTGPGGTEGCGGLTGVTPLGRYRDWILETAKKLGATPAPG